MKIELLREKLKGIHAHDTASVGVWEVMGCPFCDAANGFVGGCHATLDYLKVGVLQCRADFRHAGWVSGTGYANMVDLKFHESEILIYPTVVPSDKLMEIVALGKESEGVMFKANNPYHPDDGGKFVKVASDFHLGEITSIPSKIDVSKLMAAINEKWVMQPKYDGMKMMTNPCLEVPLPSKVGGDAIKHQVTMKVTVKPKAYPMPLQNPKSVWGKRMAEKLAQKS